MELCTSSLVRLAQVSRDKAALAEIALQMRVLFDYPPPDEPSRDIDAEGIAGNCWWEIPDELFEGLFVALSALTSGQRLYYFAGSLAAALVLLTNEPTKANREKAGRFGMILSAIFDHEEGRLQEDWRQLTDQQLKLISRALLAITPFLSDWRVPVTEIWSPLLSYVARWQWTT